MVFQRGKEGRDKGVSEEGRREETRVFLREAGNRHGCF